MSDEAAPAPSDLVTVAEAADRLGVSERSLRRALAEAESGTDAAKYAASRQATTRRTRSGKRTAAAYPLALLHALVDKSEREYSDNKTNDAGEYSGDTGDKTGAAPSTLPVLSASFDVSELVATIAEERRRADVAEAVAAEVKGERDRLRADLEHEREARRLAQETATAALTALEREQSRASVLIAAAAQGRLIEPATSGQRAGNGNEPDAPAVTTGGADSGDSGPQVETPALGFWARLFGKGKEAA